MEMSEYEKRCEEAPTAEITDGKTVFRHLPMYADYEAKYDTKQCYEDAFRKLKEVPETKKDSYYLLALMETKRKIIETMFEYHDGIRTLFKKEFVLQSLRYEEMTAEEKAAYLASAYAACQNKTLLSYKYLPELNQKYRRLAAEDINGSAECMVLNAIKQCFVEGEIYDSVSHTLEIFQKGND